jgi:hypothetical protein
MKLLRASQNRCVIRLVNVSKYDWISTDIQ